MARLTKSNLPQFDVDIFQNEYLAEGAREVNAIVTVTATGGGTGAQVGSLSDGPAAAVVIMVDCSGSMDYPSAKIHAAREATAAAIDAVRDGVAFAVVAGTHEAKEVYPGSGQLAVSHPGTREEAKQSLRRLTPGGGTAIGTWLSKADQLFLSRRDISIRHGILLTDGRNEHEKPADLQRTLDRVQGHFTADCRGVGTDWEVEELRRVSSALLGTVDIVADPAGLAEDFRAMMENAMGKEVADVALRVWTPANAAVKFVKQVAPAVEDLTGRRRDTAPEEGTARSASNKGGGGRRVGDYPTGSWGDESRDYHVCIEVPSAAVGSEMLAGRISLVVPQPDGSTEVLSQGLVKAVWTDDISASTRISPQVAHYTGQADLANAIQEGMEAHRRGDVDHATSKLGKAVQLAHESGNEDTFRLLAKVVDVVDPKEGTVRFRKNVSEADSMTLETRSTKTVRVKKTP